MKLWFSVAIAFFSCAALALSQQSSAPVQRGMATGGAHAPVRDALHRPITAGGFVDGAPVIFEDVTKQSGLASFHQHSGSAEKSTILDAPGSGVALLDYDNDGWLDIYLLNGSTVGALKGTEPAPRAALFHNNHDGTFTDVTALSRAAEKAHTAGASLLLAKARREQAWLYENSGRQEQMEAAVREAKRLYLAARDRRGVAQAATLEGIALD